MKTRMEKYYIINDDEIKQRTKQNQHLYREIYEDVDYTNIEGAFSIEKTNEIDIRKIKELLRSEEIKEETNNKPLKRETKEYEPIITEPVKERNYDIRDVLNKAKNDREPSQNKHYSLKNTQYDILKNLNINNNEPVENEKELENLINTITNTSMLNKLGDKELSLNMFSELQSLNNTTIEKSGLINNILEETKNTIEIPKEEIDKSFYTSSLNFKEKDFEELKDINVSLKKSNTLIKVTLTILFLVIIGVIVYFIFNL